MNLRDYLISVNKELFVQSEESSILGNKVFFFQDSNVDLSLYNIAIIGVNEDRGSSNIGSSQAADIIRKKLYGLYSPSSKVKIIDLGNFVTTQSLNDTYVGLVDLLHYLIQQNVIPILIGGTQNLTLSMFNAYEQNQRFINLVSIDSRLDMLESENVPENESWTNKLICLKSPFLFNYTNIGYQSYFVSQDNIDLINSLYFDAFRLGNIRKDIKVTEPILRDSDIISFDISAIRSSDAIGNCNASPNGFTGEEACQLAKYAGLSSKVNSFGIFESNPQKDISEQTSYLTAQIIWYFIEGFYLRKIEYPASDAANFKKFIVHINDVHDLIFYKSLKTERWWFEMPYQKIKNRSLFISCTYDDYVTASNHEVPDRWRKAFQKINMFED